MTDKRTFMIPREFTRYDENPDTWHTGTALEIYERSAKLRVNSDHDVPGSSDPAFLRPLNPPDYNDDGLPLQCVSGVTTAGGVVIWCRAGDSGHDGLCWGTDGFGGHVEWKWSRLPCAHCGTRSINACDVCSKPYCGQCRPCPDCHECLTEACASLGHP